MSLLLPLLNAKTRGNSGKALNVSPAQSCDGWASLYQKAISPMPDSCRSPALGHALRCSEHGAQGYIHTRIMRCHPSSRRAGSIQQNEEGFMINFWNVFQSLTNLLAWFRVFPPGVYPVAEHSYLPHRARAALPLTSSKLEAIEAMQDPKPEMQARQVQAKKKNNRGRSSRRADEAYQERQVNLLGGCLPPCNRCHLYYYVLM